MSEIDPTEFKAALEGFQNDIRSFRDEKVRLDEQKKTVEGQLKDLKQEFLRIRVSPDKESIERRISELGEEMKTKREKIEGILSQSSS